MTRSNRARAPASAASSTTSAPRCSTWSTATPSGPHEIGGVVIHDPVDEPVLPARRARARRRASTTPDQVAALLARRSASSGAAGLVAARAGRR